MIYLIIGIIFIIGAAIIIVLVANDNIIATGTNLIVTLLLVLAGGLSIGKYIEKASIKKLNLNQYQVTFTLEVNELDYTQENLREFIYHYLEQGDISANNPLLEYGLLELGVDNISIKPIN